MFTQLLFASLMEDFVFYFSHRLLHTPFLYRHIHKIHHQFIATMSLAGEYAHPMEYLFGNLIPASVGIALLGPKVHIWVVLMWGILRTAESMDGHCGYEFSFSPFRLLPFSGSSDYHDFHHCYNVGNYGSFFNLWDTILGTNKPYNDWMSD